MLFVALAWLAVWLTPEQQPASTKNIQVQMDAATKRTVIESNPFLADSVFSFVI